MDIEFALLSKILKEQNFEDLSLAGITQSYFADPDNAAIYTWIRDHRSRYGKSPGLEAFRHEWPVDDLAETPEPLQYYVDEIRTQRKYTLVNVMLDEVREPLKQGDADMVVKIMAASLGGIHTEVNSLQDETVNDTMEQRMSYYRNLSTQTGLLGWPTGFATMDRATSGLQAGQLITLMGLTKVKKSMLLMCMDIACNKAGARTMFVSFEMTNREQMTRHDALRAGISLTGLQRGQLTTDEWGKLRKMGHGLEDMPSFILVHDPVNHATVSAIAAKISVHEPDVVFIDGAYMMDADDPDLSPNSPQALTSITRSLKQLALQAEIPIVQTTQALTWKSRKGLTVDSIGYSSSFAQDSDVIFGVEEVKSGDGRIDDRLLLLRIIASRNCPRHDVQLAVNLDKGSILEIEEVTYRSDDEPEEGDE